MMVWKCDSEDRATVSLLKDSASSIGKQKRARRVHLNIPLHYRAFGSTKWVSADLLNISATGILFHGFDILPAGTHVEVNFRLPAVGRESAVGEVAGKAVVIRSKAASAAGAEIAIKLIGPRLRPSAMPRPPS